MNEKALHPVMKTDPLIEDVVKRAFTDQAGKYFDSAGSDPADNLALREKILKEVNDLGFCDALPDLLDPDAWSDAAAIIRAQAYSGLPLDMVDILVRRDSTTAIANESGHYQAIAIGSGAKDLDTLAILTAIGRCLQINAGMEAAIDISLQYVQDRKQFGRPLSAFQAIQHSLAIAAEEVAASTAATDLALARLINSGVDQRFTALLLAAALVNCSAVTNVFEVSHQVHGAIGFTREYSLHRHTLNLLSWRDQLQALLGSEIDIAQTLGAGAVRQGGVWTAVTKLMGNDGAGGDS